MSVAAGLSPTVPPDVRPPLPPAAWNCGPARPTCLRATPSAGARHRPERTTDDHRRTAVAT
jgi:hypothetical protein